MKKFVVLLVAAILVAAFLMLSSWESPTPYSAGGNASPPANVVATDAMSDAATPTSYASQRQPASKAAYEFKPPIFASLPGDLNGRPLKEHYEELARLADGGNDDAALSLGNLVDECAELLYVLANRAGLGSADPVVQKFLDEQAVVARKECPTLGEKALASAGDWYMRATELGNRKALLRLQYRAPSSAGPQADEKRARWRTVVVDGLARLADEGDFDAAVGLGRLYLDEGGLDSAREAFRWFDLASRAPVSPGRLEYAIKMRDRLGKEIAAAGKNNG